MILCAGESLIDMVPQDGSFRPLAGGAVFNTAIALGRLGVDAGYLWPISRDPFGEQILRPLAEAGVNTDLCPRTDRLTTLALVTLENGDARYSFYDEGSAGRMMTRDDIAPLPDEVTTLFAGGISLVPDPCGATVESLIADHHGDRVVMIDPNIRPFFITQPDAFRARLDRILPMADIVKLSADDLEWLHPDLTPEDAARKVQASGPRMVLLTGGETGARAFWAGDTVSAPAVRTTVADTIGAGDTFNAGFMASLSQQGLLSKAALAAITPEQIKAALTLGAQAASVTVSRAGANPPWAHEMPA